MNTKNPIEQILDENNLDNITLYDEDNNPIEFEQIALLPLSNNKLYSFMVPVTEMQGVNEGEGVLFEIDEEKGSIQVVNDLEVIEEAMKLYEKLVDDSENSDKNN